MNTAAQAVEATGLGVMMRDSLWAFPIVETVHIASLAIVVGSLVVLDLRLLGLSRRVPLGRLAAHVLPWMLKMGLILAAGVNAAILHLGAMQRSGAWDTDAGPPAQVRVAAAASILLWLGVIGCGRLLAYT